MENETEIIRRCLDGDDEAFEKLVDEYEERVYWIAYGNVGDREVARDLAQEAFVRVYKSLEQFDLDRNFYTWLYRIVKNLCIDWHRKHGRYNKTSIEHVARPESDRRYPDADAHNRELQEMVHEVLQELPEKYRLVLTLRELEGMDAKDISDVIECKPSTTRWRIHRARELFREAWEEKTEDMEYPLMNESGKKSQ